LESLGLYRSKNILKNYPTKNVLLLFNKKIMRKILLFSLFLPSVFVFSQRRPSNLDGKILQSAERQGQVFQDSLDKSQFETESTANNTPEAPIDWYKIISINKDTIAIDTTLTIKKEYQFNYLRKDLFGLLSFPNEGQTYNILDFGLTNFSPYPEMGFKAKHFAYMEIDDINYYHVPTPTTDLFYKSVMNQGQILDAFITVNTSPNLNFSVAYKGIRSVGKYINSISSNGVFRFTTSYKSIDNRYVGSYHFTSQDFENGENGGIVETENFESGKGPFTDRAKLEVFYRNATSFLKGNRIFVDHLYRINRTKTQNNLIFAHRFYYENKEFKFTQQTPHQRLGTSYVTSNVNDKTDYGRMYNRLGTIYQNETLGDFMFFIDDFRYNYRYDRIILNSGNIIVPNKLSKSINTIGGEYTYYKNKWKGVLMYARSFDDENLSNLDLLTRYTLNSENKINIRYQNINKLPDNIYNLYQSDYLQYNWYNNFKNQKINNLEIEFSLKWVDASVQITNINDYLYFSNLGIDQQLITTPKQYEKSISYFGVKLSKEFRFGKFALDNTILYQQVDQNDKILNVPEVITRNTFYFSEHLFRKKMYIQTGISLNYFTKYYANDYNGIIGEFFVQNQTKIGNFPMIDFFINAKVSTAQIYLKVEHFNSSFTGYNFYTTPGQPYRDFIVRFGILWRFFS